MSNKLKYGVVPSYGCEPAYTWEAEMLASDVLSPKSGRLVVYDIGDTYFRAVNNGENKVSGYVDQDFTASSTSGNDKIPIAMNCDQFATEMPYATAGAAGTLTAATLKTYIAKLFDLYVTGNIQYADNQQNDSLMRVIGGDVDNNTIYVVVMNAILGQIA
jgi:hypothetical protein